MDKAIEIKRRAQRCIVTGDLDGALAEYSKLAALENADPYNYILLADLTYKKGQHDRAYERYLQATDSYEKAGLYKNAIAVCKKMIRLKLSAPAVLKRLAVLHALDGLATESALYWMQYAEHLTHENRYKEACDCLRQAVEACPENTRTLEKLAEVQILGGDNRAAATSFAQAASGYQRQGATKDAERCRRRAEQLHQGAVSAVEGESNPAGPKATAPQLARSSPPPRPTSATPVAPPARDEKTRERPTLSVVGGSDAPLELLPRTAIEPGAPPIAIREAPSDGGAATTRPGPAPGLKFAPTDRISPSEAPVGPAPALEPSSVARPAAPERLGGAAAADRTAVGRPEEPGSAPGAPRFPGAPASAREPSPAAPGTSGNALAEVEALLKRAEEEFRAGDREAAGRTLMRAASGYEELGKLESAAVIYRSLSKSPSAPRDAGLRWLENAERRGQRAEAAQVACELGDRTLNDGDAAGARAWFERARALEPANEQAQRRLARLGAPADAAAPPVAAFPRAPAPAATGVAAPAAVGARGTRAAGPQMKPASVSGSGAAEAAVGPDLSALLTEFQRGVQPLIADDAQSNYDLGMAYREMNLLDQAVQCFRVAGRNPAFTHRCAEMIGRSQLEQGDFNGAVAEFRTALELPGLDEATSADLRFQLGIAHEAAGRPQEALNEFERAYAQHPGHPDVAQKIRVLRRALENV